MGPAATKNVGQGLAIAAALVGPLVLEALADGSLVWEAVETGLVDEAYEA